MPTPSQSKAEKCPFCNKKFTYHVEYDYCSQWRYDGISEHVCEPCKIRVGRWTGLILKEGEVEMPFGAENPFIPVDCACGKQRNPKYPTCFDCFTK